MTIEAVFAQGVFAPIQPVSLPENTKVELTYSAVPANPPQPALPKWFTDLQEFRARLRAKYGVLPDSTPDIRAMRDGNKYVDL